jgi:hypothetical protein
MGGPMIAPTDIVLVVRFQRESGGTKEALDWRVSITDSSTHSRIYVDGIEAAFAAIRTKLQEAKSNLKRLDKP